jgi:hypothetical protein
MLVGLGVVGVVAATAARKVEAVVRPVVGSATGARMADPHLGRLGRREVARQRHPWTGWGGGSSGRGRKRVRRRRRGGLEGWLLRRQRVEDGRVTSGGAKLLLLLWRRRRRRQRRRWIATTPKHMIRL